MAPRAGEWLPSILDFSVSETAVETKRRVTWIWQLAAVGSEPLKETPTDQVVSEIEGRTGREKRGSRLRRKRRRETSQEKDGTSQAKKSSSEQAESETVWRGFHRADYHTNLRATIKAKC